MFLSKMSAEVLSRKGGKHNSLSIFPTLTKCSPPFGHYQSMLLGQPRHCYSAAYRLALCAGDVSCGATRRMRGTSYGNGPYQHSQRTNGYYACKWRALPRASTIRIFARGLQESIWMTTPSSARRITLLRAATRQAARQCAIRKQRLAAAALRWSQRERVQMRCRCAADAT